MKHILKLPLGTVPKFEVSEERTLDGAPSVVVTFPDGYTDTIRLSRHYANDEDRLVSPTLWHYRLWSFQGRDTKLERFLHKNQL